MPNYATETLSAVSRFLFVVTLAWSTSLWAQEPRTITPRGPMPDREQATIGLF